MTSLSWGFLFVSGVLLVFLLFFETSLILFLPTLYLINMLSIQQAH